MRAYSVVPAVQESGMSDRRLADMVELILSKFLYERFLLLCGLSEDDFVPNSQHLARCFGIKEQAIDWLYEQTLEDNEKLQLEKYLAILSENASPFWEDPDAATDEDLAASNSEEELFQLLQREIADLGLASEKHAFQLYLQKTPFTNEMLSSIITPHSLQCLLNKIELQYQKEYPDKKVNRPKMIAYLLHLVDQGMAGFKWSSSLNKMGQFYTEITAGEPSMFLKPMMYAKYLMVLEDVQKKCRINKTPVKWELHKLEGAIGLEDAREKKQLAEELALFVEDLNSSGQKVSDWLFPVQFLIFPLRSIEDDNSIERSVKRIRGMQDRRHKAQTWEQLDRMLAYQLT